MKPAKALWGALFVIFLLFVFLGFLTMLISFPGLALKFIGLVGTIVIGYAFTKELKSYIRSFKAE